MCPHRQKPAQKPLQKPSLRTPLKVVQPKHLLCTPLVAKPSLRTPLVALQQEHSLRPPLVDVQPAPLCENSRLATLPRCKAASSQSQDTTVSTCGRTHSNRPYLTTPTTTTRGRRRGGPNIEDQSQHLFNRLVKSTIKHSRHKACVPEESVGSLVLDTVKLNLEERLDEASKCPGSVCEGVNQACNFYEYEQELLEIQWEGVVAGGEDDGRCKEPVAKWLDQVRQIKSDLYRPYFFYHRFHFTARVYSSMK